MNAANSRDIDPEQILRVERLADAFEDAWQSGRPQTVEDFLAGVEEGDRAALRPALLDLDAHYGGRRDEHPTTPSPGQAPTVTLGELAAGPGGSEPFPPQTFPGYEVLGVLGRGGMGVVYKARDTKLGRVVAIKTILAAFATPDRFARFNREARATAALSHPGIVPIRTIGESNGLPFLELEFVDGGSLADRLSRGDRFTPPDAAGLVERLARAVHHAHDNEIVHRDLKPANILLTADGTPKVTDFGLAKFAGEADGLTATGVMMGTAQYMAPEQFHDSKSVGEAADVYSLGVILFELLTRRLPFGAEAPPVMMRRVLEDSAPRPSSIDAGVPPELDAVCLKCLEKRPADRYLSAEALAEDLGAFLEGRPLPHTRVGAGLFRVGVDPNCTPFAFRTDEGGELVGLDVDLARAIAVRLERDVEFVERPWASWSEMLGLLEARHVDALVSAVTVTPARKRQVALVEYANDPLVFTARPGSGITSARDLAGKVVAVQEGTTAKEAAERLRGDGIEFTIVPYPTTPEPFAAVRRGHADVTLDHGLIAHHEAARDGALKVLGAVVDQRILQPLGVALRKGDGKLRNDIEQALEELKDNGELAGLLAKWDGARSR